jgi:hypothetical protein
LASAAIAVPVLAGTSAYVMTQMFGWRGSLNAPFGQARAFYAVLLGSLAYFGWAVTTIVTASCVAFLALTIRGV